MTDPITITFPCVWSYEYGSETLTIDADSARRIVALAQADVPSVVGCTVNLISSRICQRGQKGCIIDHDAPPVADDEAAVTAMVPWITDASLPDKCDPAMIAMHHAIACNAARNVLAAIKQGKIPGCRYAV